jgi:hypothetical protein
VWVLEQDPGDGCSAVAIGINAQAMNDEGLIESLMAKMFEGDCLARCADEFAFQRMRNCLACGASSRSPPTDDQRPHQADETSRGCQRSHNVPGRPACLMEVGPY